MRRLALVLAVFLAVASCGGADATPPGTAPASTTEMPATTRPPSTPAPTATTSTTIAATSASAEVLAAAARQLIAEDHTFGDGPPPFTEYLIQERIDPTAGDPTGSATSARPLTAAELAAIEGAVAEFGPVRFIADPDEWRTDELLPTIEGAVILGFGEPLLEGDTALVPVSLWCGGLCGTWLTYRLELSDGEWRVTGTEGPIAIS